MSFYLQKMFLRSLKMISIHLWHYYDPSQNLKILNFFTEIVPESVLGWCLENFDNFCHIFLLKTEMNPLRKKMFLDLIYFHFLWKNEIYLTYLWYLYKWRIKMLVVLKSVSRLALFYCRIHYWAAIPLLNYFFFRMPKEQLLN